MAEETKTEGEAPETESSGLPKEVSDIVRRHAIYAAAGGLIPLPVVEFFTSSAIQLRMVGQLCDHYGLHFSEQAVKAAIGTMVGSALPVGTAGYVSSSLVRFVPFLGPVIGLTTLPALAAAMTWAVGRVFAWHFANGGTLENFDAAAKKEQVKREFQEGKRRAAEFVKNAGGSKGSPAAEPAKA
ncbi:Uncharacterized conserved protein, DUF697 family [Tistlia consotensis]|uniref:Uncharacterized conserved protein, DUF697 family n=1 Tax=Tistlia consotensis USBA 355 TaxID=560819 RepID=A0A1Y6C594_9PROT|nr:DUF697 domain-containing protein [Tistlia consotensis]SMF44580.1 Uncharacterized conserved protein, DUF697 family [Tistlia consotensis USBA 355]SNR43369.1 Uncharacterized conserved protein, DUF697 family [Tistlia consotensis]